MREIAWICGINLGIVVAYTVASIVGSHQGYFQGLEIVAMVVIHAMFCGLAAMMVNAEGKKAWAKAFLLAAVMVLMLGFPACAVVMNS